jgi:uncharacterized protein (TIGR03067 family)
MRLVAALFFVATCLPFGCQQREPAIMKDEDKIQGKWLLISGEREGKMFSDETIKNVTLTFDGNILYTRKPDGVSEATFSLHPEANPKGIDLNMDGNVGLGIYYFQDDTLTILHGEIEEPRPANFEEIKGGTLTLLRLRKTSE